MATIDKGNTNIDNPESPILDEDIIDKNIDLFKYGYEDLTKCGATKYCGNDKRICWPHPIKWIMVHHTEGKTHNSDPPEAVNEINKFHRLNHRGYFTRNSRSDPSCEADIHIGYHFVITYDGKLYKTRCLSDMGHHAGNYFDATSISVCVVGNFIYIRPTKEQKETLSSFITLMRTVFNIDKNHVVGHKEVRGKKDRTCPGRWLLSWLDNLRGTITKSGEYTPRDKNGRKIRSIWEGWRIATIKDSRTLKEVRNERYGISTPLGVVIKVKNSILAWIESKAKFKLCTPRNEYSYPRYFKKRLIIIPGEDRNGKQRAWYDNLPANYDREMKKIWASLKWNRRRKDIVSVEDTPTINDIKTFTSRYTAAAFESGKAYDIYPITLLGLAAFISVWGTEIPKETKHNLFRLTTQHLPKEKNIKESYDNTGVPRSGTERRGVSTNYPIKVKRKFVVIKSPADCFNKFCNMVKTDRRFRKAWNKRQDEATFLELLSKTPIVSTIPGPSSFDDDVETDNPFKVGVNDATAIMVKASGKTIKKYIKKCIKEAMSVFSSTTPTTPPATL